MIIYIADDEKNIRELLKTFLTEEGYEVELFENGDALMEAFNLKQPHMVILDIMMPGTDGLTVCSHIRKKSNVPIILLTARDTDADYITGFTVGADDYFTKPFSPIKLVMRVKAMFKRMSIESEPKEKEVLTYGDIELNTMKKSATCKESSLKLTTTEFNLMQFLIENEERAVSRDELLNVIWGYESDVETRVTDDTIKRIRKKLKDLNSTVSVETVWGFGFKLEKE